MCIKHLFTTLRLFKKKRTEGLNAERYVSVCTGQEKDIRLHVIKAQTVSENKKRK